MFLRLQAYRIKKKIQQNKQAVIASVVFAIVLSMFLLLFFGRSSGSTYSAQISTTRPVSKSTHKSIIKKANACFVILVRNEDLKELKKTLKNLERVFNKEYSYPYVFLNDVPFTDEFISNIKDLTESKVEFGLIPTEHWSIPDWIDKEKAKEDRKKMQDAHIIYGGSLPYRHMCRYESGFFFRHPLTLKYDYYWRVEPGVSFSCKIRFDPFLELIEANKKYGFVISLKEFESTIPTLWKTVNEYIKEKGLSETLPKDNALDFISNDKGKTYNLCHFWSNFEIASFELLRSQSYLDFFDYLDKKGGFFYERWGDAPVHSIYAALFLKKEEIHFYNKIAYTHPPYSHCPIEKDLNEECFCDPKSNFDYDGYSCTKKWFDLVGHK